MKHTIKNKCNLCFVAGKSGGHTIPALTIAKRIKIQNPDSYIMFFTTDGKLDKKIVSKNYIVDQYIPLSLENIPYKNILGYPIFFINLTKAFLKSFYHMLKNRPKKVISLGGYISIPVCFAAFLLRVPIELFEPNATPGRAIKLLSPLANTISICFSQAKKSLPHKKCKLTDYPIRFQADSDNKPKKQIFKKYNLFQLKQTLLILGGSQGSIEINNLIKQWAINNPHLHDTVQVIHQTGNHDKTDWATFYKKIKIPAITFDFKNDISEYYQLADLVICRSGAGTLFETIFFKKKCITIPLETKTTNHQVDNARAASQLHPKNITAIRQIEIKNGLWQIYSLINEKLELKP